MNPDLSRTVKFRNPEKGEENMKFMIVNFNEITNRVYIRPTEYDGTIYPEQLVSLDDLIYAD